MALVNSEPITNFEVSQRLGAVVQQLTQQGVELPPRNVLVRQVLERIVNDRAQIQLAKETGVKVDEVAVDQAEANMARQNQMDIVQLRKRLAEEGVSASRFRDDLRQQLVLQRLRERVGLSADTDTVLRERLHSMFLQRGLPVPERIVETASVPLTTQLLRGSDMLVALPEAVVRPDCQAGMLCVLPIELHVRLEAFGLITRRGRVRPDDVEQVLAALRDAAGRVYRRPGVP